MLCVGDELLDGRTRDRNANTLGALATREGWHLSEIRTVADELGAIRDALSSLVRAADVVVTSGGLGPTSDDVTREAIAAAAGVALEVDPAAVERLHARYAARGRAMSETNLRQARFPQGARVHPSDVGTADPFCVDVAGARVAALPGVPSEFDALLEPMLRPLLPSVGGSSRAALHLVGIGESDIAAIVEGTDTAGTSIAYSAHSPYVTLTIRGGAAEVGSASGALSEVLGAWLVPEGAPSLPEALGRLFARDGLRLATAESCTGGAIASLVTDVAGASGWFDRGWVTYSNAAKERELGVPAELLERVGAVSAPVAAAMARGARSRSGAQVAVAVSGVAGPGGGTPEKPVGLVFIGVCGPAGGHVIRARFAGASRAEFKRHTAALALLASIRVAEGGRSARTSRAGDGVESLRSARGVEWIGSFEECQQ